MTVKVIGSFAYSPGVSKPRQDGILTSPITRHIAVCKLLCFTPGYCALYLEVEQKSSEYLSSSPLLSLRGTVCSVVTSKPSIIIGPYMRAHVQHSMSSLAVDTEYGLKAAVHADEQGTRDEPRLETGLRVFASPTQDHRRCNIKLLFMHA